MAATPKPGLVDRNNSGAHSDMDIYTFLSSASVLHPYFAEMAAEGRRFTDSDLSELLGILRPIGIEAEKVMFKITKGVNTHKGLIFSLGILSAAAARQFEQNRNFHAEDICRTASFMCRGIVEKELKGSDRAETTGEKLYRSEGISGIRGEAEAGFPSVISSGLPALRNSDGDWNIRLIDTLLHLMTVVQDSNVLGRQDQNTLKIIRKQVKEVLLTGGASDDRGMEILKQMDMEFIEKNISPGGSADLLAVTVFLYKLENSGKN